MLIGIDASKAASKQKTGIENLVYQLILNLQAIDRINRYLLYTPLQLDKELTTSINFQQKLIPFTKLWNKIRLPLELLKNKPDVFLMPGYMVPSFSPPRTVVIIHDLAYKFFPDAYSKSELLLQELAAKQAAKKAAKIIFPSESTRNDFLKFHRFSIKKTAVIPLGYNRTLNTNFSKRNVLRLKTPYILYVGRLEKRKNITTLVKAFQIFKQKTQLPHKLVLAGKPGYKYDEIIQIIDQLGKLSEDVILPGFISDEKIVGLYSGADAFCLISLYEGFGMPLLEAFASRIPVVTSNTSSLTEVAGEAAVKVDPTNEVEVAEALIKIIQDKFLREKLIKEGLSRVQNYSWQIFAKKVLAVLESV